MNRIPFTLVALAALVSGCKTPQPALDLARHGESMSTVMSGGLSLSQKRQAAVDRLNQQQSNDDVAREKDLARRRPAHDQLDAFGRNDRLLTASTTLRNRASVLEATWTAEAAVDVPVAAPPLPPLGAAVDATGRAFAALGTELPFKDRAALAAAFVQDVRKQVKENREAANSSTATATVPAK